MKKWHSLPGLIFALIFIITATFFIHRSYQASEKFRTEKSKVAEILNFNDRILSARDWLFTEKTWLEKKEQFETQVITSEAHLKEAKKNGEYLIYLSLCFFVVIVAFYARKRLFFGLTFATAFVSMALLGQGVFNPILEMSAFKEDITIKFYVEADEIPYYEEAVVFLEDVSEYIGMVNGTIELVKVIPASDGWVSDLQGIVSGYQEIIIQGEQYLVDNRDQKVGIDKVFPGRTYFYYQNKGIMEVIHLLWTTDNKPVAIAIGLFSVLVPCIKLFFSLFILLFGVKGAKRLRKFLYYIAKWSMADVFVVAAFLAYLSFSNMSPGVSMDAQILFGLYYFLGYVILSIPLGFLLDASIRERIKIEERAVHDEKSDNELID